MALLCAALTVAAFHQDAAGPRSVFSFAVGGFGEQGVALAVDGDGNSYVVGSRVNPAAPFPVSGNAAQQNAASMYVAKIDARGDRLAWATYLGGSRNRNWYWRGPLEYPTAIAVDSQRNVVVTGSTAASDYPVENAVIGSPLTTGSEGFLTKISADGSRLIYSTYLAGYAMAVAADALGNAYVAIQAENIRLPFERVDLSSPGVSGSVVIAKFNPAGQPVYATRFGTTSTQVTALSIDAMGAAIVIGTAIDRGFPLVRPITSACARGVNSECRGPYVVKLDPAGSRFVYSTLLGGTSGDTTMSSLAVAPSGDAYVAGLTRAADYPIANAYQRSLAGGLDFVVSRIGPAGELLASTFLGGEADESAVPGPRLVVDATGRVTLFGSSGALSGIASDRRHPDAPLWRSDDEGRTWRPSANGLRTSTWTFAVSTRDRIWYAGASDGVYRSVDGGASWDRTMAGGPAGERATYALAVDPARSGVVYAGTSSGIYRTANGGAAWLQVNDDAISGAGVGPSAGLAVDGNGTVFLGTEGLRRSVDGGVTWVDSSAGFERGPTGRYGAIGPITFDPNQAGVVYALQSDRMYRSRDGGATWGRVENPRPRGALSPVTGFYGLAAVPGRPGRLFASGWTELLRSDDDGASWELLLNAGVFRAGLLVDAARPDRVYAVDRWAGSDEFVVSADAGQHWTPSHLPSGKPRAFALDPLQPGVLFAPSEVRALPLVVAFDAGLRRPIQDAFLDGPAVHAAAADALGNLFVLRTVNSRTVLDKLVP